MTTPNLDRIRAIQDRELIQLRDALRPFAEYASGALKAFPDDTVITVGSRMARRQLTLGDCRKALAALND